MPASSMSLRYAVPVAAVLSLSLGVLIAATASELAAVDNHEIAGWVFAAAVVSFVVCGGFVVRRFASDRDAFALLPLATVFFLLEFAAGAVFYRKPRTDSALLNLGNLYEPPDMTIAVLVAFGSWVALIIGYLAARPIRPLFTSRPASLPRHEVVVTATVLWVSGFAIRAFEFQQGWYFHLTEATGASASPIRNFVEIGANLPLLATLLVGTARYRARHPNPWPFRLLVLCELAWAIPSGERSRLIIIGVALLVVRYYSTSKPIPRKPVIATALLAVFVVFPFGIAYRDIGDTPTGYQQDPVSNLAKTIGTMDFTPAALFANGTTQTLKRFVGITSLAVIANQGTEPYPGRPQDALNAYASAFIPRALLPTKVDPSTLANDFGHAYGIIRPANTTSVAMTTVGDLWGTFGAIGLAVGMILIGVVVRALTTLFGDLRTNQAKTAVYATFVGGFLLNFEASVANGLMQSVKELILYTLAVTITLKITRLLVSHDRKPDHHPEPRVFAN